MSALFRELFNGPMDAFVWGSIFGGLVVGYVCFMLAHWKGNRG